MNQNRREFLKTMAAGPVAAVVGAAVPVTNGRVGKFILTNCEVGYIRTWNPNANTIERITTHFVGIGEYRMVKGKHSPTTVMDCI